jgi:hypothetical protein
MSNANKNSNFSELVVNGSTKPIVEKNIHPHRKLETKSQTVKYDNSWTNSNTIKNDNSWTKEKNYEPSLVYDTGVKCEIKSYDNLLKIITYKYNLDILTKIEIPIDERKKAAIIDINTNYTSILDDKNVYKNKDGVSIIVDDNDNNNNKFSAFDQDRYYTEETIRQVKDSIIENIKQSKDFKYYIWDPLWKKIDANGYIIQQKYNAISGYLIVGNPNFEKHIRVTSYNGKFPNIPKGVIDINDINTFINSMDSISRQRLIFNIFNNNMNIYGKFNFTIYNTNYNTNKEIIYENKKEDTDDNCKNFDITELRTIFKKILNYDNVFIEFNQKNVYTKDILYSFNENLSDICKYTAIREFKEETSIDMVSFLSSIQGPIFFKKKYCDESIIERNKYYYYIELGENEYNELTNIINNTVKHISDNNPLTHEVSDIYYKKYLKYKNKYLKLKELANK